MSTDSAKPLRTKRLKRFAIGCLSGAVLLFLSCSGALWALTRPDHDLAKLPVGQEYSATKYEFRYGAATRTIDDKWNRLRFVYGELPDAITVTDGQRLIVYNSPKCIIKSSADAIDVQDDTVQHKGYMGIWSDDLHFEIDRSGVVQLADDKPVEP
tara:strand:+ start:261 stop:725 length:465 start_codon:yes stop_codon:yes gene_type:complete